MLSDCHVGLEYSLEETGGVSEYNVNIFEQRMKKLTVGLTDIVELHSQLYSLPTLHIFCLGDIVAGMNDAGAWSSTYINSTIWDQVIKGYEAISDAIYYWLGLFENIKFYGVIGNHARAASKGIEKEYVNWDYVCYNYLKLRFQNNDRVQFVIPKTWWIKEKIRNHKFLMVHGDDVRPSGSHLSSLNTLSEKMVGIIKEIPDYTLAGHFHNSGEWETNNGRVILNGAFTGGDMYSLKNLQLKSRPCQRVFGIHDKRGITWSYNLHLDK
jgi:predicted phosphodiesterase